MAVVVTVAVADVPPQKKRTAQGVIGFVIVLSVIGLEHHEALVALEDLLDVIDDGLKLLFLEPGLLLDPVGTPVQREYQKAESET